MHRLLLLYILTLPAWAVNILGYVRGGTVNSYAYSTAGFNSAVTDAITYQTSTACISYYIILPANNTLDLNGSAYTLAAKNCAQYIHIQSSGYYSLPFRGRVIPSLHSAFLSRIQSTVASGSNGGLINLVSNKTRYWAFEGIDFYGVSGAADGSIFYFNLLLLGETGANYPASVDPSLRPDHFIVDQCWLHGLQGSRNVGNAIGVGADHVYITNSYFEDIAVDGGEGHAVSLGYIAVDAILLNNHFDSSTEDTLVGGTFMPAGLIPSFLVFNGNEYTKKGWYHFGTGPGMPTNPFCLDGSIWRNQTNNTDYSCLSDTWSPIGSIGSAPTLNGPSVVKNLWEVKMCRYCFVYGNDMSNLWISSQNGEAFVVNLTTQPTGGNPPWVQPNNVTAQNWTTAENVYVRYNKIHTTVATFTLGFPSSAGTLCNTPDPPPATVPCYQWGHHNVDYSNNLATDLMNERLYNFDDSAGGGFSFSTNIGNYNIKEDHNTNVISTSTSNSGQMHQLAGTAEDIGLAGMYNMEIANNIAPIGMYGLLASGASSGLCGSFFPGLASGAAYNLSGNAWTTDLAAWNGSSYPFLTTAVPGCSSTPNYAAGTAAPANAAAIVNPSTFAVIAPYIGTATDGTDPGPNLTILNNATAHTADGVYNPFLEMNINTVLPAAGGATIYATALDTTTCTATASTSLTFGSSTGSVSISQTGRMVTATFSGASNNTGYFLKLTCNGKYVIGEVVTGH